MADFSPVIAETPELTDPWAQPLTVAIAIVAGVAVFAPSAVLAGAGFIVIRALMSAACVLVAVRRKRVLLSPETWIVWNMAVLFNPFFEFWLYERERWVWVDIGTAVALCVLLHRTSKPDPAFKNGLIGLLVGIYGSLLVAGGLVDEADREVQQLLALPVLLALSTGVVWWVSEWLLLAAVVIVESPLKKAIPKSLHPLPDRLSEYLSRADTSERRTPDA